MLPIALSLPPLYVSVRFPRHLQYRVNIFKHVRADDIITLAIENLDGPLEIVRHFISLKNAPTEK